MRRAGCSNSSARRDHCSSAASRIIPFRCCLGCDHAVSCEIRFELQASEPPSRKKTPQPTQAMMMDLSCCGGMIWTTTAMPLGCAEMTSFCGHPRASRSFYLPMCVRVVRFSLVLSVGPLLCRPSTKTAVGNLAASLNTRPETAHWCVANHSPVRGSDK